MDANIAYSSIARGESLNSEQLHQLCMLYCEKTAYDGITPQQLATEYLLARDSILDYMQNSNELPPQPDARPKGFKLQDNARP